MNSEVNQNSCILIHSTDPLGAFSGIKSYIFDEGFTIYDKLEEIGQIDGERYFDGKPCYVTINGHPILRKRYPEIVLESNDILIIQTQPWGGGGGEGGSDPMRVLLGIGVMALAIYTGNYVAGLEGFGLIAGAAASVAVSVAGGLLIDIIAPVEMPEAQKANLPSPTYDLRAQGNMARLGEPIPCRFGTHYFYPDFAAIPFVNSASPTDRQTTLAGQIGDSPDFENPALWEALGESPERAASLAQYAQQNPQDYANINLYYTLSLYNLTTGENSAATGNAVRYINSLYCIGIGEYDVQEIFVGDTNVNDLAQDITWEIIPPGGDVTLYPIDVATSSDVTGQSINSLNDSLPSSGGWWVLGSSGQTYRTVDLDFSMLGGLYIINSVGSHYHERIDLRLNWELATGGGGGSADISIYANTAQAYYYTTTVTLPSLNRYKFRLTRTYSTAVPGESVSYLNWSGFRARLEQSGGEKHNFPNYTMLAVRMLVGEGLSLQSNRKVNVLATRKLNRWNGSTFDAVATATDDVGQAMIEICRAEYGGQQIDANIDLDGMRQIGIDSVARGEKFAFSYDSSMGTWDALRLAASRVHAEPSIQYGKIRTIEDKKQTVSRGSFDSDNIVPNSLKTSYVIPNAATVDAITVSFYDVDNQGKYQEVLCVPTGSVGLNPVTIPAPGIVTRDEAHEWGLRKAHGTLYRKRFMEWESFTEGFLPGKFDVVDVSSTEIESHQFSGIVKSVSGNTVKISTIDIPSAPGGETYYIAFRDRAGADVGTLSGSYSASIIDGSTVSVSSVPAGVLSQIASGGNTEPTHFYMGPGTYYRRRVKVISVAPVSETEIKFSGVIEDDRVFEPGAVPAVPVAPDWLLDPNASGPAIGTVSAEMQGTPNFPVLFLYWDHVVGAARYQIYKSRDNSQWDYHSDTSVPSSRIQLFTEDDETYPVYFKVRAVGFTPGPFSNIITVASYDMVFSAPTDITGLQLREPFTGTRCYIEWDVVDTVSKIEIDVIWLSVIKRTEVLDPGSKWYSYGYTDAIDDDPRTTDGLLGVKDGARHLTFNVRKLGFDDQRSGVDAVLSVSNPQFQQLQNIQYEEYGGGISVKFKQPESPPDYSGAMFFIGDTPGFIPGASELLGYGPSNDVYFPNAIPTDGTTKYLIVGAYDIWGYDEMVYTSDIPVSSTDDFVKGPITYPDVEWDDIIGPNKPDDNAEANNPSPVGIQINTATFNGGNGSADAYFYVHGYRGGVAVDEPANVLCGDTVRAIPNGPGVAKRYNTIGWIAYTWNPTVFTVEDVVSYVVFVWFYEGQWYYDNGKTGGGYGDYIWPWTPDYSVFLIADAFSWSGILESVTPWPTGRVCDNVIPNWDAIEGRPTAEDLLNINQEWEHVNTIPDGVYNNTTIWDDISDLQNTNNELYNSDTTWVDIGAVNEDTPVEILNENVLYAGLADAPNDSDIYNNLQTYENLVGLKPPTNATQNGQRGLCFDPDFGLSADPAGPGLLGYFRWFSPGRVGAAEGYGEHGTAAAIIYPDGASSIYVQGQRIPCKQGDRFYVLARVKLSSASMYPHCGIYVEEYDEKLDGSGLVGAGSKVCANTSNWQTIVYVHDVTAATAEGFYAWVLAGSGASSSGTFTIDSFDWWPITEKMTSGNIGSYIDNLAVRTALIGDASIINLKVAGDALFLQSHQTWGSPDDWVPLIIPQGHTGQFGNWISFANFYFDMTGRQVGQSLIVHYVKCPALYFTFDSAADVLLDIQLYINGSPRQRLYQWDHEGSVEFGWQHFPHWPVTNVDSPLYRCGQDVNSQLVDRATRGLGWGINPYNGGAIEIGALAVENVFDALNHVELRFRIMTGPSPTYPALTGDYFYEPGYAVIAAGRSPTT